MKKRIISKKEKEYLEELHKAAPVAIRKKWRRWLERISRDITGLYRDLQIYKELLEIIKNQRFHQTPIFFRWCQKNYVVAICIGIRRLSDTDFRSVSLRRLLEELFERPDVLTRKSYRALYRAKGLTSLEADNDFERNTGQGKETISKKLVYTDIRKLEKTDNRIRLFVNKRLAHHAPLDEIRKIPTYDDIENALEVFDELATKYYRLLTGAGVVTFYGTPQYDWRKVFQEPWLDRNYSKWPKKYYGPHHAKINK